MTNLSISFDVDMVDYYSNVFFDEIKNTFGHIKRVLKNHERIKTTWFFRIDSQIESIFGDRLYLFNEHRNVINWLKKNGHEVGLHFHSYERTAGVWKQCLDENKVAEELYLSASLGRKLGLDGVRMGWGYHTNLTMKIVNDLGYFYDSSAIPRPAYNFEKPVRDWSITPNYTFRPSMLDYRVPGHPSLDILEVPMTTMKISTPTDTVEMLRCISPGYKNDVFLDIIGRCNNDEIILMTHPYEIVDSNNKNYLNSHSLMHFELNMKYLETQQFNFLTLREVAEKNSKENIKEKTNNES